jgi:hypothetical protein
MHTLGAVFKRYALWLFFPLAYLLSWASVLLPQAGGGILPYGPTLAALILIALTEGREGLSTWWKRVTNWRVSWIWFLVAPAILILFHLGGASINLLLGATLQPVDWSQVWPGVILLAFLGGQWEEPGWTAYALPKLQDRFAGRPVLASSILGILRGLWHLPLVISGAIPWYDALFYSLAMQFAISWLDNRTNGSVPIAFLFHFTSNALFVVMRQLFTGADGTRHSILFIAVGCLLTALLVTSTGSRLGVQKSFEKDLCHSERSEESPVV